MKARDKLFDRYTSTSSLAHVDEATVLKWSYSYFKTHYSRFLPTDKKANVLEIGCGYGRYLKALSDMGYVNCRGIDISQEQILYAKNTLNLSNVEKADALDWMENKDAEFDCILALDILEHLDNDYLLNLGEAIYKALKPGGRVIIQVPNGISPMNPIRYGDLTHVRAFTESSIRQFLIYGGFELEGIYDIPPHIYSVVSAVRFILWAIVLKPLLHVFARIAHGSLANGVYTQNFIFVGKKPLKELQV